MSISSIVNRSDYIGTGLVTTYSYSFKIFLESHLLVTKRTAAGVESTLVLNTDYTVTGVGSPSGGTIVLATALAASSELTIRRVLPLTQTTDISNQTSFFAKTHEDTFDRLTMQIQQQQDELERALKVPENEDSIGDLPALADRAGNFLAFDVDGEPIAAAAVSSVAVSVFMETVLDDTTAAAVRATLGIGNEDLVFDQGKGPVIKSPDGLTSWRVVVDNDGNIGAEQV